MQFRSRALPRFWHQYDTLPVKIQHQADKQYLLFRSDPRHPSLYLKPVGPFWSVRVSGSYRALAIRTGAVFVWFWIGPHEFQNEANEDRAKGLTGNETVNSTLFWPPASCEQPPVVQFRSSCVASFLAALRHPSRWASLQSEARWTILVDPCVWIVQGLGLSRSRWAARRL